MKCFWLVYDKETRVVRDSETRRDERKPNAGKKIRVPTAPSTTEPSKGRQLPALGISSLGTYLGARRDLYSQSHLQESCPLLTPSPRW
ncbi:hypothetical protein AVEN_222714-1 [Araneus ventricosus]|uniref:Uncharacterized protein n=1 Tax=Araneus ventricosus TaxID=182803 RepID=A0A4Y2B1C2_ARAVE|nr:hypothetical protein AVEN_222714-1 [Araneus ventricosus]